MRGEIKSDLAEALGVDVVPLEPLGVEPCRTHFGFPMDGWKPWTTFDGTPSLVPERFNTEAEPDGSILQYPEGDVSVTPSGKMEYGGTKPHALSRQGPLDDLTVEDMLEGFGPISDNELEHFRKEAIRLHRDSPYAIHMTTTDTLLANVVTFVMAPWLKHPKGIRTPEEWYMSLVTRKEYIYELLQRHCDLAQDNLDKIRQAVGGKVTVVYAGGADMGMQTGPMIAPQAYRELYMPAFQRICEWIHENTIWKAFHHTCGSVVAFMEDLVRTGIDILNPLQCSAANMDPREIKAAYGDKLVFWGGGVNTQSTLPHGTPDDVRNEVRERIRAWAPGGGYVFAADQHILPDVPVANLLAMFDAAREYGRYPIQ
jgi:uroporphyrinogen-III decarboxylase